MTYASNSPIGVSPTSQKMSGYALESESSERTQFNNYAIMELKKEAEKMGLTPEIYDLIETHKECQKSLQKQAIKLGLLQAFAMESIDENVVELRNQLFTVVTLLYSDKIDESIKELITQDDSVAMLDTDIGIKFDSSGSNEVKEDCSRYDIITRMKEYMRKRGHYKTQLADIKRNLKYNMGL